MILIWYNLLYISGNPAAADRRDAASSGRWWWVCPWGQVEVSALVDTSRDGQSWAPDSGWGVNPKPYVPPPQRTPNSKLKASVWNHTETSLFLLWALHHSKTKYPTFIGSQRKLNLDHQTRSSFMENLTMEILQFYVGYFNPIVVQQETKDASTIEKRVWTIPCLINAHNNAMQSQIFSCCLCKACFALLLSFLWILMADSQHKRKGTAVISIGPLT